MWKIITPNIKSDQSSCSPLFDGYFGGHTMSAWPLGCIQWTEWMDRKLPCCFGGNGSPATQRPDMMRQPAMSGIPTRRHCCFKMIMTLSYTTTDDPDCFGKDTSILGRLEIRMCSSAVRVIIPGGGIYGSGSQLVMIRIPPADPKTKNRASVNGLSRSDKLPNKEVPGS